MQVRFVNYPGLTRCQAITQCGWMVDMNYSDMLYRNCIARPHSVKIKPHMNENLSRLKFKADSHPVQV